MYLNLNHYCPLTLKTKNFVSSLASVIVPVQLRQEQVDMPDISDTTRICSQVSPARSLQTARVQLERTEVTNSRQRVRRRHTPGDDIEFSFLRDTNFSSLCGCSRVQIFPLIRYGCYPRPTSCMATTHTTLACIGASGRASGCTMVPIQVVQSRSSTTISKGGV